MVVLFQVQPTHILSTSQSDSKFLSLLTTDEYAKNSNLKLRPSNEFSLNAGKARLKKLPFLQNVELAGLIDFAESSISVGCAGAILINALNNQGREEGEIIIDQLKLFCSDDYLQISRDALW